VHRYAPARPGDTVHSQGDPSATQAELGFSTAVDIETGLAALSGLPD
jgi:hypothetical protein